MVEGTRKPARATNVWKPRAAWMSAHVPPSNHIAWPKLNAAKLAKAQAPSKFGGRFW